MYSFAKFQADHIFLQNRDKKNSLVGHVRWPFVLFKERDKPRLVQILAGLIGCLIYPFFECKVENFIRFNLADYP
jgi:hypothetical protein